MVIARKLSTFAFVACMGTWTTASALDIRIDGSGVTIGPVKIDPVPIEQRVLSDIARGVDPKDSINERIKNKRVEMESMVRAPQIQTEIENNFLEQLRGVVGDDVTGAIQVLRMPEQITRAVPEAALLAIKGVKSPEEVVKGIASAPLLAALLQAREHYKDRGKPIPTEVKLLLMKSFTAEDLNRARYVVDDFGGTLPAIINQTQEIFGDQHAVVVDNIIVYSSEPRNEHVYFWAHAMQHTVQYKRLGMAGFASEYTTNYRGIEGEADRVGRETEAQAMEILSFLGMMAALTTPMVAE